MTLATVPRYDPDSLTQPSGHAVVVGASMAGLCAARVLADAFEEVTVVERDPLPQEPVARRGVPQARHFHALLEAGRATLEDLFPRFGVDLESAGAVQQDAAREFDFHIEGDFLANGTKPQPVYFATRPTYEYVVRQRVGALDGVHLRPDCQFTDFLVGERATTVKGVAVRTEEEAVDEIGADLVVDATGRTSRTPSWLRDNGFPTPTVDEVDIKVAYSTTVIDRPTSDRTAAAVIPSPRQPRGGAVAPVEDGRWLMTLWGVHDDAPPTDPAGFETYAASLPVGHFHELLETHSWRTDDIPHYVFPANLRRRYEALDRFPNGLVVIGDALVSFNPIYGQGMSVAALEALHLHHTLAATGRNNLAKHFFARVKDSVDIAWNMAVGSDHRFPQTEGHKPRGTGPFNWYLRRLLLQAHTDSRLFDAFFEVQSMQKPPTSLIRPSVIWRVFGPSG